MPYGQIDNREWGWVVVISGLLILLTLLPYVLAYNAAAPDHHFMGILVNPLDGNSYLAKMQQGVQGNWLFHLTYTPENHRPVLLFTFYLLLGHVAAWMALPTALVFHTARVVGSLFMLLMLYSFVAYWTDDVPQRRVTWLLAGAGSGFGWLLIGTGHVTPDLNVPEAFPLYAAYANAHFPWAIAVLLLVAHTLARVLLEEEHGEPGLNASTFGLVVATVFLFAIQPMVLLPLGAGVGILLARRWWRGRRFPRREIAWAAVVPLAALPQATYLAWVLSSANPVFNAWTQQNRTPSPPPWDYALAFGPLLILAGLAIWKTWPRLKGRDYDGDVLLLGWLMSNLLLLYAPFSLQRRLAMGLIVPLALYAGRGLSRVVLPAVRRRWRPLVIAATFLVSAPGTLLALSLPLYGTLTLDSRLFVTQTEQAALDWLGSHAAPNDVVLAAPSFSIYVPSYAGPRVVYGHEFETVRAEERLEAVEAFYTGEDCTLPQSESIDFVVFGPREALIGDGCEQPGEPVFALEDLSIYATGD